MRGSRVDWDFVERLEAAIRPAYAMNVWVTLEDFRGPIILRRIGRAFGSGIVEMMLQRPNEHKSESHWVKVHENPRGYHRHWPNATTQEDVEIAEAMELINGFWLPDPIAHVELSASMGWYDAPDVVMVGARRARFDPPMQSLPRRKSVAP